MFRIGNLCTLFPPSPPTFALTWVRSLPLLLQQIQTRWLGFVAKKGLIVMPIYLSILSQHGQLSDSLFSEHSCSQLLANDAFCSRCNSMVRECCCMLLGITLLLETSFFVKTTYILLLEAIMFEHLRSNRRHDFPNTSWFIPMTQIQDHLLRGMSICHFNRPYWRLLVQLVKSFKLPFLFIANLYKCLLHKLHGGHAESG